METMQRLSQIIMQVRLQSIMQSRTVVVDGLSVCLQGQRALCVISWDSKTIYKWHGHAMDNASQQQAMMALYRYGQNAMLHEAQLTARAPLLLLCHRYLLFSVEFHPLYVKIAEERTGV